MAGFVSTVVPSLSVPQGRAERAVIMAQPFAILINMIEKVVEAMSPDSIGLRKPG
jgi:hypothetical protein